jgi:hypothetical protein
MNRRDFISLVSGGAAWPIAARAQQPDRVRRIGVLMGFPESDSQAQGYIAAFRGGLQKLGWMVTTPTTTALLQQTRTIPIVFGGWNAGRPAGMGGLRD